jgi:hypothetical protein
LDINLELACTALLALVQIEDPTGKIDNYHITEIITEIIKALQENAATDHQMVKRTIVKLSALAPSQSC